MFAARTAALSDLPALSALMKRAIETLQTDFLTPAQVEASHKVMGLDSTLVQDGTYFVIEEARGDQVEIVGCGGWSRRNTLYGGDHSAGRNAALLDPRVDAARVRAMYTDPAHVRRGIGTLILKLCEDAAKAEGFSRLELMGTLAGEPLYKAHGFVELDRIEDLGVPLVRMGKAI
jgi:GNAT superfamily N-acetyltransferase